IPVWFVGGMLLGMISPGKTFIEPVVASFLVAIPTVFYLAKGETVRTMPLFMYVIMALIGVLFTLIGAYIRERIQIGPPPKPADELPRASRIAIAIAILSSTACRRPADAGDRERVLHALDALRDAPGDALPERTRLLDALAATTAISPGPARARDACVA